MPITSAGQTVGGVIAGITEDVNVGQEELNQMSGLTVIAGQALERIVLTSAVTERNNRLEAILKSVSEGIFFIDDNDKVTFCNPQVTELTRFWIHKVLHQNSYLISNELASVTSNASATLGQLQAARAAVVGADYRNGDYPITQLALVNQDRTVTLEFVKIDGRNPRKISLGRRAAYRDA